MFRTLYSKLALTLVGLMIAVGLLYSIITLSLNHDHQQQLYQQLNRDLAANLVMERNLVAEGKLNQQALKDTFMAYMVINPSIEIYLLDINGTILAYSAEPGKVKREKVDLNSIHKFLKDERAFPLLGDDPRSHDRQKAFSVTPVPSAEKPEGYLYVVLRGEQYDHVEQLIQNQLWAKLSGWAVAGSLLFGLLAGLLLFHLLTRRINQLARGMSDFQHSDYSEPPKLPAKQGGDEVDRLSQSFSAMAARISEQMAQLKQQDALRRELVANVSHDLRTPLAIMYGYLETLKLKQAVLTPEEYQQYLDLALRNSEHLETLVAALFELAKLEAHETVPVLEPIQLAELAQDVVQKFQLRAQQQGITVDCKINHTLPYVQGDIALIERVLENLIGNALKHSNAEGKVTLSIELEEQGVMVSVEDDGCGIESDALPYIFDRFYQADNSSRNSEHAGLGLAITKRILALHKSDIKVDSCMGEGTRFSFFLAEMPVS